MLDKTLIRSAGIVAALAAAATPASAQTLLTPRALGMGGAYLSIARGQESLFLNPANLALPGNPTWSISVPAVMLSGSTWGPDFGGFFEQIARSDGDSEEMDSRFAELLADVPAEGMRMDLEARPLVAVQTGRLAFGVSAAGISRNTLSRDVADLMLNGFDESRTDYSVGNTGGSSVSYLDVAAGYGTSFGPLSVGITGHYLRGRSLSNARFYDLRVDTLAQRLEIDYAEVFAKNGSGYAVDVGAALEPVPNVTLSAAVTNVVGSMEWSDELYVRELTITDEDFEDPAGLPDRFTTAEERRLGTGARETALAEGISDGMTLPRTLRVGASVALPTYTRLAMGYQKTLAEGLMASGWERSVSAGIQQRLLLVTARVGYATDLGDQSMLSAGLSVGPLDVGVAILDGESNGHHDSGVTATIGLGLRGAIRR